MKRLDTNTRNKYHCEYYTECKGNYCRHEKCIYPPEVKKHKGMPWEAVFGRVMV